MLSFPFYFVIYGRPGSYLNKYFFYTNFALKHNLFLTLFLKTNFNDRIHDLQGAI